MRLLHFIRRNPWQFIINDEFFLCESEKALLEKVNSLIEEYDIQQEDIEEETFSVSLIKKVNGFKRIKFKSVDQKKVQIP